MFFQNITFGHQAVQLVFVSVAVTEFAKGFDYNLRRIKFKPPRADRMQDPQETCPNEK